MRSHLTVVAAVVAALLASGCENTSRLAAPAEPSGLADNRSVSVRAQGLAERSLDPALLPDIGVPGGVTLEPFARGAFPHPIDAMFKFRYGRPTEVLHVRDASDVIAARLTIAEGGSAGWHRHPGSAIGVVQSGTFGVIEESDCVLRLYNAGDVFFHRGQNILDVGFNAGQGDVVAYVTFIGVPAGQPATIPVHEPPC